MNLFAQLFVPGTWFLDSALMEGVVPVSCTSCQGSKQASRERVTPSPLCLLCT